MVDGNSLDKAEVKLEGDKIIVLLTSVSSTSKLHNRSSDYIQHWKMKKSL